MKKLTGFVLWAVICCMPVMAMEGTWLSFDGAPLSADGERVPQVTVLASDADHTILEISVPGVWVSEKVEQDEVFQLLTIPGSEYRYEVGKPQVPVLGRLVAVPNRRQVAISVLEDESQELEGYRLYPTQVHPLRCEGNQPSVFSIDMGSYASASPFPMEEVSFEGPFIMRDVRHVRVEWRPVQSIAADKLIRIHSRMVVELRYYGEDTVNVLPEDTGIVSPTFERIYRAAFINYEETDQMLSRGETEPYIIIVYDDFYDNILPLAEWKQLRGVEPHIYRKSEVGSSANDIKNFLINMYNSWDPKPVYVLLVGDSPQIPTHTGMSGCASDYLYTNIAGSDIIPDLLIARLSAQSGSEVDNQVNKFLRYERYPDTGTEAEWYTRSTGISSSQGKLRENDDVRLEAIRDLWLAWGHTQVDRFYHSNGQDTVANIQAAVNEGRNSVTYVGHGSGYAWTTTSPDFEISHIHSLDNGYRTPTVMDVACLNGGFTGSSDCFGEAWLKTGSVDTPRGAISCWSSSISCSWDPPAVLGIGFTHSYTNDGYVSTGSCALGAMLYLIAEMGTGSDVEQVLHEFVLFSEPSLLIRGRVPGEPVVEYPLSVPMVPQDLEVTVSVDGIGYPDALVCAYKDGEVFEVGTTDGSGRVTLGIYPQTLGDLLLTVSERNLQPFEAAIPVMTPGCGIVSLDDDLYNCAAPVNITLWDSDLNLDPGEIDLADVQVNSNAEPDPEVVTLTETGPDSAQFEGFITLSRSESGPGYLLVVHQDTITVTYYDAECEGEPDTVIETAQADCQGPEIDMVFISDITAESARITWVTSEMADSRIYYGEGVPPLLEVYDPVLVTNHEIVLTDLDVCTTYYFAVESTDAQDNTSYDDNGGAYYYFRTQGLYKALDEPMDTDPGWTTEGNWGFGQPTGSGGQYGNPDPSSGYDGANVYGYNLYGDYDNYMPQYVLRTIPFDCSDGNNVQLSFWRFLNVEQPQYDEAKVQVSNDGSNWTTVWENDSTTTDSEWDWYQYDISAVADNQPTVYVQWVMGPTDVGWTYSGWNVDNVEVSYSFECPEPTVTPFPTATATPLPSSTPTAEPTATLTPTTPSTATPTVPPPPSATPTEPPPFTATPTAPPNPTATPTGPPPPTATPAPDGLYIYLKLNQTVYRGGDEFRLLCDVFNFGPEILVERYIILEAYGHYYFWPGWTENLDYLLSQYAAGETSENEDILVFGWPPDAGNGTAAFWTACLFPGTVDLASNLETVSFSWE